MPFGKDMGFAGGIVATAMSLKIPNTSRAAPSSYPTPVNNTCKQIPSTNATTPRAVTSSVLRASNSPADSAHSRATTFNAGRRKAARYSSYSNSTRPRSPCSHSPSNRASPPARSLPDSHNSTSPASISPNRSLACRSAATISSSSVAK
ncbi:hypothetical protein Saa2_03962 [Streptomyces acidiscabies]|nr:hypothetical protein Saa2_03962 [Streptomyces acidiscabies]